MEEKRKMRIEENFYKTTVGKFMLIVAIVMLVSLVFGFIIAIAEYLDISVHQKVIDLGKLCRESGAKISLYYMFFYVLVLPSLMKEKKETSEKKSKINSTTIYMILLFIAMIGTILKFITEICGILL